MRTTYNDNGLSMYTPEDFNGYTLKRAIRNDPYDTVNQDTHEGRLLNLLIKNKDDLVSLPDIMRLGIGQYNYVISNLREKGYIIINYSDFVGRRARSFFALIDRRSPNAIFKGFKKYIEKEKLVYRINKSK